MKLLAFVPNVAFAVVSPTDRRRGWRIALEGAAVEMAGMVAFCLAVEWTLYLLRMALQSHRLAV